MKGQGMRPADEADVSELLRGAKGPFALRGGGTRGALLAGEVLDCSGLSGVRLYEPAALTLVVGAGTPLADVEALLAGERQRLAFEVPDLRAVLGRTGVSTIGGVYAANASGPRRVQVGACRDAALGVRFVDGSGAVVKNGGRVMKNVTGYDLVKLMAGSQGSLGVITEVSFKLQALPEAEATLILDLPVAEGLAALRRALGSPFDISGAAYAEGRAAIRLEGMAGSVAYRVAQIRALLGGDWQVLEGTDSQALWQGIRDLAPLLGQGAALWRIVCVPSEALAVPRALEAAGVVHQALFDWGGGLLWLACGEGEGARIRAALAGRGEARRLKGSEASPAFSPPAPGIAALQAGLKARFDPKGLFNPGGMV
jgi:glycolate oxidase FAD binding subunit